MQPDGPVIAFRADASTDIGTGHVMRCLALADALRERGATCHFLCRSLPGNLASAITGKGHACHLLPLPTSSLSDSSTAHSAWLGTTQAADAQDCAPILDAIRPSWLIVDHYALDRAWEAAVRRDGMRLLAIDDLADRSHDCDILLDQNLGRIAADYDGLVPDGCVRLIGPEHALLRPEFAACRAAALARRGQGPARRILVSMGGVDRDNVTARVLDALAGATLAPGTVIDVVLGATAPWRETVAEQAARMPVPTRLHVAVPDMARMMTAADLAIGASGSTSWERCCLGLPTLVMVLAENQRPAADALEAAGAAIRMGGGDSMVCIPAAADLAAMSVKAAALVDGLGAVRVMSSLQLGDGA